MNVDLLAANLAAHWIQAGLIGTATILALAVLRVRDPRLRLVVLQLTLWLIVLMPWAQPWRELDAAPPVSTPAPLSFEGTPDSAPPPSTPPAAASTIDPIAVALAIVGAGIVVRLSWLAYGGLCLVRFRRNGRAIPVPDVANELQTRLKVSPRYLESRTPGGPSTFGFFGATIALPSGFGDLDPKFQRAIICHELLHVRRRDTAMALVEELLTAALWFHPWMWLIRSRVRVAREQVVDRMVLKLIGDRADYIRCLIELSGHDLLPHLGTGMLSSRELRTRIDTMFQEAQMSRSRMIGVSITLAAVAAITVGVAATCAPLQATTIAEIYPALPAPPGSPLALLRGVVAVPAPAPAALTQVAAPGGRGRGVQAAVPAPGAPRTRTKVAYAEYPLDALEKGISGTVSVNIVVNAAGDVTSAGVISGPQELRASAFKAALGLKYAPGPSTTAMTISVNFLLDQESWGVRIGDNTARETTAALLALSERTRQAIGTPQQTTGAGTPPGVYRVGGDIRQPRKVKDVRPVYPPLARSARVQGVVIIEASIDAAGNVGDARILRSIPLLDQAAVDAVQQWQYEPTLMNGAAVPVIMTVTVNFTLSDELTLRVTLPNGTTTVLRYQSPSGVATIDFPGTGQFGFAIAKEPGSDNVQVSISEFSSGVQRPLGSVDVALGSGLVQSATTPSFGIQVDRVAR